MSRISRHKTISLLLAIIMILTPAAAIVPIFAKTPGKEENDDAHLFDPGIYDSPLYDDPDVINEEIKLLDERIREYRFGIESSANKEDIQAYANLILTMEDAELYLQAKLDEMASEHIEEVIREAAPNISYTDLQKALIEARNNKEEYFELENGTQLKELMQTTQERFSMVAYAMGFIGHPYVWGGVDPENGIDCSGFAQHIYHVFGYEIPRTTWSQEPALKLVEYKDAQPGDLIYYYGHVAMYAGDGVIVHAANRVSGICIGKAQYRPITSVRTAIGEE